MPSPSGAARDRAVAAAAAEVARWETLLTDQLHALWDRQQGVVLARLQGVKARRGTRHWYGPAVPGTEVKALDPRYILDPARWLLEAVNAARALLRRMVRSVVDRALARYGRRRLAPAADGPATVVIVPNTPVERPLSPEPVADVLPDVDLDLEMPEAPVTDAELDAIVEERLRVMGDSVTAAAQRVQDRIADVDAGGAPMTDIVEEVRAVYVEETAAWTERAVALSVVGALNDASLTAARAAGVTSKQWLSAHDGRTRPTHVAADGQVVPVGQPFSVGAGQLDFPGDTRGPIGEWINCLPDGDTPVLMADGSERPVRDVRVGDRVVTHRARARAVTALSHRTAQVEVVVLTTSAGRTLRVTANHPVLTSEGWVVAGEVTPGAVLLEAASVQRGDGVEDLGLAFVRGGSVGAAAAARALRPLREQPGLLALDDEVREQFGAQQARVTGSDLPAVDGVPLRSVDGTGGEVDDTDTGDLAAELDEPGVGVRDDDARSVVVPGAVGAGAAHAGDGDGALAVNEGGKVGEGDGFHVSMVPQTVTHCAVRRETTPLWNFAVDEDESYCAARTVVHNCRCTLLFPMPGLPVYVAPASPASVPASVRS